MASEPVTSGADLSFMRQAIAEAHKSEPIESAYCVGAVLVDAARGTVLATGYSRELPGNTHAEECCFMKIAESKATVAGGDTQLCMYTTMEPCSKRLSGKTPCCERIVSAGVKRVVVGALEPDVFVNCEGVDFLRQHGVIVDRTPELAQQCLAPNQHLLGST